MKRKNTLQTATSSFKTLSHAQLRRVCDCKKLKFENTATLPSLQEIIGQDRAVHALTFGLDIHDNGYHIYALGPIGTGKTTVIRKYLVKEAKRKAVPPDWLYINNFDDNDKPKKLQLPAGKGREFRDDMNQMVSELKNEVPKAFEAESYEKEREGIEKEFRTHSDELLQALAKKAAEREFQLIQTTHGFAVLPTVNGKVMTATEHAKLGEKQRKSIEAKQEELINEVHETMRHFEQLQREGRERMNELDQRVVSFAVNHIIDAIKQKYSHFSEIVDYLAAVRTHLLKNVQAFKRIKQNENVSMQERLLAYGGNEPTFEEYKVNLIVDNSKTEGAPVVFETNPIGPNLIGRIEQQGLFGALVTNFLMIKGGALHRANGGYLILDFLDVLKKPLAWEMLKRALKNKELVVESMIENLGVFSTRTLEPEPIPLQVKVVLVGNPMFYYLVYEYDPEFRELFKVKADFATYMPWDDNTAYQYAEFISMVCNEEKLPHFSPDAVAKIVEYGSRIVEHQQKLSTKFGDIADIIRESSYWANKQQKTLVTAIDVQKALDEKVYRANRIEEIIREMIAEKTIKISTTDATVGQINGLSVLSMGDYAFGKPSRITAKTYVGGSGIVSIEREIDMGGPIHNKASMIIAGYLGGKYAQKVPIALSASLTFEQVYEGVEGDSASAAEIYAIISSLSEIPLRQDLAITGSVNQHGEIQAIGGVNEKIEGFFRVCKVFGLTGKQGVIIPESNAKHLMLHEEVLAAVKAGKFNIYTIATIDEGIPLLLNKPAGELKKDGTYPKGTINQIVQQKVVDFASKAKEFAAGEGKKKKKK